MTATAVTIPDYVVVKQPQTIRDLAGTLAELLAEADGLPWPRRAELWSGEIELGFGKEPATFRALADWAQRFGGTLTGEPIHSKDGREVRCEVRFVYHATDVRAYAYVTTQHDT